MCGIAGLFGPDAEQVEGMLDVLGHRGPDARAVLPLPELDGALGHTRLSIIDLDPRSNQPFTTEDGRYALVYNGEIYNYRELRQRLDAEGARLRTESDTEVLLIWLVRNGLEGLHDLDGMFAFALLDREAGRLILARDRIGEKPLYFAHTASPRGFAFCSEMRGLSQLPSVDTSLDEEALKNYLRFLYTPAPETLYAGIRELEPGCTMTVDLRDGTRSVDRYYDLEEAVGRRQTLAPPDCYSRFREAFDRALERRLEADVPISLYFSGGVDSSLMLGGVRGLPDAPDVETFTISYGGSRQSAAADEGRPARRLARQWGIRNRRIDFTAELPFHEAVQRIVDRFHHPFGNSTALVADVLAERVSESYKVALAGDGGDELTGGYPRYRALLVKKYLDWVGPLPGVVGRLCLPAASLWPRMLALGRRLRFLGHGVGRPPEKAFLRWSTYLDADEVARATGGSTRATEYQETLESLFRRNSDDLLRAASLVDLHSFVPYNLLRNADRTGMAHSLEVRVPFLAPDVVEAALSVDRSSRYRWGEPKRLFRESFGGRIPDWVWSRRKMAFNPPIHDYLDNHVEELEDFITGPGGRVSEILEDRFVREQLSDFRSRRSENSTLLWGLATLEAWLRRN